MGIQNKVLEALATGTPVVATKNAVGALKIQSGEDLIVVEDEEGMSTAVLELLRNPGKRNKLGAAGRKFVEKNHQWEQVTCKLESIYEDVVNG
jgi:glycosyltransferase involved in cell wall biosynthesis